MGRKAKTRVKDTEGVADSGTNRAKALCHRHRRHPLEGGLLSLSPPPRRGREDVQGLAGTFLFSQATNQAASSRLLLSCMSMCELPLMPRSGSTTNSVFPPAFFIASANSRHCFRRGAQRGERST